ncbi:hypothetical protein B0H13DRAFT_1919144 [Mycena leptocephala]|nr:hypothetical protein B0H13DRAFT_1919144 [Mycena leptocephala]
MTPSDTPGIKFLSIPLWQESIDPTALKSSVFRVSGSRASGTALSVSGVKIENVSLQIQRAQVKTEPRDAGVPVSSSPPSIIEISSDEDYTDVQIVDPQSNIEVVVGADKKVGRSTRTAGS